MRWVKLTSVTDHGATIRVNLATISWLEDTTLGGTRLWPIGGGIATIVKEPQEQIMALAEEATQ